MLSLEKTTEFASELPSELAPRISAGRFLELLSYYALFWFLSLSFLLALVGCNSEPGEQSGTRKHLSSSRQDSRLLAGQIAPDFSVTDILGKPRMLSEMRGRTVVLNFWATWCAPCVHEMPSLERLALQFGPEELQVVAVSVDNDAGIVREFVERNGLSFNVWHDPQLQAASAYGTTGFPETFVVDASGRFVALMDPESGQPTVRFVADRAWDTEPFLAQFSKLIATAKLAPHNSVSVKQIAAE